MPKKIIAIILVFMFLFSSNAFARSYETKVEKGVNFRNAPSTNGKVLRMIPKGDNIHVVKKVNSYWLEVIVKDGTVGYISAQPQYTNYSGGSSSVAPSTPSAPSIPSTSSWEAKADAIIAHSKSLIGKVNYQYSVRNRTEYILDCSSFTQWMYEKEGISIKWGTKYQKDAGTYVSKANLRKGDLVFFSANSTSINHVGIYIGDNQFIHNASSGGVQISDFEGFWGKEYETGRRVL
jgi:cell wall-associated NlpC family hydrolase